MRLRQRLLDLPPGVDVVTFVRHDGQPPAAGRAEEVQKETTFAEFREAYTRTFGNGAPEANTLSTARTHLGHLAETLGDRFPMNGLTLADLQRHVDRRQKAVAAVTIKKEVDTLRGAWNWAARMGHVRGEFPPGKLVYPKEDARLPFMTWDEVERRVAAGGDPAAFRECLYLTTAEVADLLDFVRGRAAPGWVYPAVVFAAHTGVRRMLRPDL